MTVISKGTSFMDSCRSPCWILYRWKQGFHHSSTVVSQTLWGWHAPDWSARRLCSLCSQLQLPSTAPCAYACAQAGSGTGRAWRSHPKRSHLHGVSFSPVFSCSESTQFRSSLTPHPWASNTTRFQNARRHSQSQLWLQAQGSLFISRRKIKQSTTSWLWSKPSQRRKKPRDSGRPSPEAHQPRLRTHTKKSTGDLNCCINERPIYPLENRSGRMLRNLFEF